MLCSHGSVSWAATVQSVQRLTAGWAVRGSDPGGVEILRTRPDRPWGPPSPCTVGTGSFPGCKAAGAGVDHPHPSKARLKKEYSYISTVPLVLHSLM
jgi:hypothetical protein